MNIFQQLTRNRSTSIVSGIAFAVILLVVSIGFTPLFDPIAPYIDVNNTYDWDFSTSHDLSLSFGEYAANMLLFDTYAAEIIEVSTTDQSSSVTSKAIALFGYDVIQLAVWWNTLKEQWRTEIYYADDGSTAVVDTSDTIPLGPVADTFINEIARVDELAKVNVDTYSSFRLTNSNVGDIEVNIRQAFDDGTHFDVQFLSNAILIAVSYFEAYAADEGVSFKRSDRPYDFYVGYLEFSSDYKEAVSTLLGDIGA